MVLCYPSIVVGLLVMVYGGVEELSNVVYAQNQKDPIEIDINLNINLSQKPEDVNRRNDSNGIHNFYSQIQNYNY